MMPRFAASLLLVCATALPQTSSPFSLKSFHDPAPGITYFYPGEFTPMMPSPPAKEEGAAPHCVRTSFTGGSDPAAGNSAFVFSLIDNACPGVLKEAQQLGSFTRAQILRQMKRYGTPVIMHEPVRYSIAGHPAAVTLASAQAADTQAAGGQKKNSDGTTYAAKACMLAGNTGHDSAPKQVVCFDFTTTRRDLLPRLFAFSAQFDGETLQSLVPGTILR